MRWRARRSGPTASTTATARATAWAISSTCTRGLQAIRPPLAGENCGTARTWHDHLQRDRASTGRGGTGVRIENLIATVPWPAARNSVTSLAFETLTLYRSTRGRSSAIVCSADEAAWPRRLPCPGAGAAGTTWTLPSATGWRDAARRWPERMPRWRRCVARAAAKPARFGHHRRLRAGRSRREAIRGVRVVSIAAVCAAERGRVSRHRRDRRHAAGGDRWWHWSRPLRAAGGCLLINSGQHAPWCSARRSTSAAPPTLPHRSPPSLSAVSAAPAAAAARRPCAKPGRGRRGAGRHVQRLRRRPRRR